jgi:CHASE3 domain sensor protein
MGRIFGKIIKVLVFILLVTLIFPSAFYAQNYYGKGEIYWDSPKH